MLNTIKDFYFKYSPTFTDKVDKNNVVYIFNRFVNDTYKNIACINNISILTEVDKTFENKNLTSVYYSFVKPSNKFKLLYMDDFLIYQNVNELVKKYLKFKIKEISLKEVNTPYLRRTYIKLFNDCFSAKGEENPYSNLDNSGYCKSIFYSQKHKKEVKILLYIIKYKSKNVGCITLTIKDNLCYISGFSILKEYRRTRIFLSMINVLEILKQKGVKNVFCVTELDGYPDKLYKKIGFKSIGIAYAYKNKN